MQLLQITFLFLITLFSMSCSIRLGILIKSIKSLEGQLRHTYTPIDKILELLKKK